jgi:hypothetical protein
MTSRLIRAGDALSQLANVVLLNGEANESISGRSYREGWRRTERFINFLFSPFEKNHCQNAFDNDVRRAEELAAQF